MISKIEARMLGKTMRKAISEQDKINKEQIITKEFLSLPEVAFATNICVYLPINSEVDTKEIIKELLNQNKILFAPVTKGDDMYAVRYTGSDELVVGNFGISEPKGDVFSKEKLDLIVVPMVAFNQNKARVGYGKGYYDRFIPENAITVGVAFCEQQFDFEPQSFDKTLDIIVTDKGVLR